MHERPGRTEFSIDQRQPARAPGAGQVTLDRLQGRDCGRPALHHRRGLSRFGGSSDHPDLSDGLRVATTVGNGLFLAWWPGSATVTSATVTSPSGTSTQTIDAPPRDTGGQSTPSGKVTNQGSGNGPHTASQRTELPRFCARLSSLRAFAHPG